jgi:hypothetical protein
MPRSEPPRPERGIPCPGRRLVWDDPGGFSEPRKFFDQIPGAGLTLYLSGRIMKV